MYRCTDCSRLACFGGDAGSAPENCPMRDIAASDEIREEYGKSVDEVFREVFRC